MSAKPVSRGTHTAVAVAAMAVSLGSGACGGAAATGTSPSAPDFALPSVEGETVHLSDYLGKNVVLIDFWATTCVPCMAEMPHLVDLYKLNKDRGLVVLAISLDGPESLADVNRVVHDKEMIFPVLLDQETTVVSRYNPKRELPFAVLIDKRGSIVHKRAGYQPGDEKILTAEIEKVLQ
jgi:peroxiredoxin